MRNLKPTLSLSHFSSRAFQSGKNESPGDSHELKAEDQKSKSNGRQLENGTSDPPPFPRSEARAGTSMSEFKSRIEGKFPTIDKTAELYRLICTEGSACTTGPRRFGKSLNVTTVESIFRDGPDWWRKECPQFAITQSGYEFPVHPVLSLDFSGAKTLSGVKGQIADRLWQLLVEHGLEDEEILRKKKEYEQSHSSDDLFGYFEYGIWKLATYRAGVVVLIDEYDYPLTHLTEPVWKELSDTQQLSSHPSVEELIAFYNVLFTRIKNIRKRRTSQPLIHFFYATGCAPIQKLGLFSGPNEIAFTQQSPQYYSKLLGYTEKEIKEHFNKQITKAAKIKYRLHTTDIFPPLPEGASEEEKTEHQKERIRFIKRKTNVAKREIMKEIKENYDGFVFNHQQKEALYSPYAINCLFEYWQLESNVGTYPDFLAPQARRSSFGR